jgi:SPOR domain
MRHPLTLLTAILLIMIGCTTSKPIVIGRQPNTPVVKAPANYEEDVSWARPRYKEPLVSPTTEPRKAENTSTMPLNVNRQVDAILDTMAVRNRSIRYAAGYRIQIYVGNVRTEADAARLYTYQTFPELIPYMTYSQPTYRIRIGDFMARTDAERYLQQVKMQYNSATILAEKIEIRKSILVK